jgi:hypothetical protein
MFRENPLTIEFIRLSRDTQEYQFLITKYKDSFYGKKEIDSTDPSAKIHKLYLLFNQLI